MLVGRYRAAAHHGEGGPMNWKLIFQLSLFGLAMGVGTVFFIPSTIEPFCWLVVFLLSAYLIATRAVDRYFLHSVALGLANSILVTAAHVLLIAKFMPRTRSDAT